MKQSLKHVVFCALALTGLTFTLPSFAVTEYKDLLGVCVKQQLSSCQMTSKTLQSSQLKKYAKAFNCVKFGSTSGDRFTLGIPILKLGELGIDFGSNAASSTEQCKEEISKLNSVDFLDQISETFDEKCGMTLAGQAKECLATVRHLADANALAPQTLKCAINQSAQQIALHTRYVPGAMEEPKRYKITSVTGIQGMNCGSNLYPGTGKDGGVFVCSVPANHREGTVVIKLANNVSCPVKVQAPVGDALVVAQSQSCHATLSRSATFREFPPLLRTVMLGQCTVCLAANLSTGPTDTRSLKNRISGCAAWSVASMAVANTNYCAVAADPEGGTFLTLDNYKVNPAHPAIQITAPGTQRVMSAFIKAPGAIKEVEEGYAKSLCNARRAGEVLQMHGQAWTKPPIDFLNSPEAQVEPAKDVIAEILQ